MIAAAEAMTVASCENEGLTQAQEECVLAAKTYLELADVRECPAIAQRKPSWLRLPPTKAEQEALRQAVEEQRQGRARADENDSSKD